MENKKLLFTIGAGLCLYLLSAVFSFALLSYFHPAAAQNMGGSGINPLANVSKDKLKRDPSAPRTEECPLNGAMYTKDEQNAWSTRRPLGIMVENAKAARPQSGLSSADVVYEAVAEGGITRFMLVFYCQGADIVGPVRSARTYFLDWISEYGNYPLYGHVGGANTPGPANALGQIGQYGWQWFNDVDGIGVGLPVYITDTDRLGPNTAVEHSRYTSTTRFWDYAAQKRGITNVAADPKTGKSESWDTTFVKWTFKDDVPVAQRPASLSVSFNPSSIEASYAGDYAVKWQYDKNSNSFLRFNGGDPHTDMDTKQQIAAKTVVVLFTTLSVADDGYNEPGHGDHMLYGTIGTGKAKFLIDGKAIDGSWKKSSRTSRTVFLDSQGKPLAFNRGQIWVEVLPIGSQFTVQ